VLLLPEDQEISRLSEKQLHKIIGILGALSLVTDLKQPLHDLVEERDEVGVVEN